jgi:hypothetical protein
MTEATTMGELASENFKLKKRNEYLVEAAEAIKIIDAAINNESPDLALWEINRVHQAIGEWNGSTTHA